MRLRRLSLITLILVCLCAPSSDADDALLARLVDENTYQLKGKDETIGGPGLAFLLQATADAQFFCFAEPHNVKQVPLIFTMLFESLQQEHGFQFAALETGPVILEKAGQAPVRGSRAEVDRLFARFPRSFHFYTDQELQMIADIGRISRAEICPLWGVDQVHGTLAILDELASEVDDEQTQAKIDGLAAEVREFNKKRGSKSAFLKQDNDAFDRLRDWVQPATGSRAEFLIEQLRTSRRIYRNYILSTNGQPTGYASNCEREQNMKSLFMRYYRQAQEAGDSLPKVMLKSGHWHLMKGISPGNCYTLGTFVMDLAKANGMSSFHLMVTVVNEGKNASSITNFPQYAPITRACSVETWTVVDLRPLRAYAHSSALPDLHAELRHWIFSYDAVLLIGGTTGGGYVTDVKRRFGKL